MLLMGLVLSWTIPLTIASTCYVAQSETIRRAVIAVVPQASLVGCQMLCTADANCQATVLNASGTACVHLGAPITDPARNICPAPTTVHMKTDSNCVDIPERAIDDAYAPGECSRLSDVVGDLARDGSSPACGILPLNQRRTVIDAIQHDGTHITLENYSYSYAVWDGAVGSWYLELVDTPNNERYYFKSAKCVLAPSMPLTPNCACASLPTEPADAGNSNPTAPLKDVDPCCVSGWVQMAYLRTSDSRTWDSVERVITCMMGVWMVTRTGYAYNSYSLTAATCVD